MPLNLEIVTPEARVYSDTIETVIIPTHDGEIGILPGHIPLLTRVQFGELRLVKGGVESRLAVGNGFVQVEGDVVSVLAEHAISEAKIDETAAEEALKRAEQTLRTTKPEDFEFERLQNMVNFIGAQLALKRRLR